VADSLQEQLRKAGLVNEKKLKKAQRVKHAEEMERKTHGATSDDPIVAAQRARAEKAKRDKALNEERDRQANLKALAAQVRQLIVLNRQPRDKTADIPFNFKDGRAIKKLFVTKRHQDHLVSGQLAIVKLDDVYELVPTVVAQKIRARDPNTVIVCNDAREGPQTDTDDPYADYKIPDDLTW
jgi:uncharacterized protein YaiL (DUF2058 family)